VHHRSISPIKFKVSSWTTNGKATTAASLLVFEDNVGEDGLSSQSTYKLNIGCPCYKASIAPNPKVLNDLKPSKEQLGKVYGVLLMKEVNDMQLQIDSKKTFLTLNCQGKSFNTNITKVQAQNVVFGLLIMLNYLIGQLQTNLQDYCFVRISTTHLFSNWQSKKQFRNLPIGLFQASCLKMIHMMKKIILLHLCLHTKRALC
jgi:hypothetical protein